MFMRSVITRFYLDSSKLFFSELKQNLIYFLRAYLICFGISAKINTWSFIKSATKEGDVFKVYAASVSAGAVLRPMGSNKALPNSMPTSRNCSEARNR